jgi:hypothetical protein
VKLSILSNLAATPFSDCISLSKEFKALPMSAGIYAVKHRTLGILYIGKTRYWQDKILARQELSAIDSEGDIKLCSGHLSKNCIPQT